MAEANPSAENHPPAQSGGDVAPDPGEESSSDSSSGGEPENEVRSGPFVRLKWNILEPLTEIRVLELEGPDGADVVWKPLFDENHAVIHPLGQEPFLESPSSSIRVQCADFTDALFHIRADYSDPYDEYLPEPLLLRPQDHGDGTTPTILWGQFVKEFKQWYDVESKDDFVGSYIANYYNLSPGVPLFFDDAYFSNTDKVEVSLSSGSHIGNAVEYFDSQVRRYRARLYPHTRTAGTTTPLRWQYLMLASHQRHLVH